jgi:hypothetical protein
VRTIAAASFPRRRVFVRNITSAPRRTRVMATWITLLASLGSAATLFLFEGSDRILAAPMLAIALTAIVFVMVLWSRDCALSVFEAGTLAMLAIAVYGTMPLLGFLLMHGQWDPSADSRLSAYPFIPTELGAFGWRYAVYAIVFAVTYLVIRGRAVVKSTAFALPKPAMQTAIVAVFTALYTAKIALKFLFDYDPENFDYTDPAASSAKNLNHPYLLLQIGHNIWSALFLVQLAVIVLLLAHWRKRWCRYALVVWLGSELVVTAVRLGSRGRVVLLLISAVVLYHRLVKRLGFRVMLAGGVLLLSGFLLMGAIRLGRGGRATGERATGETTQHVLTAANEFQALFATAFDIHKRIEAGEVDSVPWQVYVSDFYLPIPSQVLPFEKIDPSSWYIDLIGQTGSGVGYMFGVMSQAAVGFNWIELVLRGAVLAAFLALLHRWYVRRHTHFWPTLLYLFVSIWAYYSFRASTFYFVYFVIYHFFPVLVITKLLELTLSRMRRRDERQPLTVSTFRKCRASAVVSEGEEVIR